MTIDATSSRPPTEIFKALADPVRWDIVMQMAAVDELACMTLEDTLPVSKPTISYHTKILYHAGLITVRKAGRNYYYSLRREVLRDLLSGLRALTPDAPPGTGPGQEVRGAVSRMRQRGGRDNNALDESVRSPAS